MVSEARPQSHCYLTGSADDDDRMPAKVALGPVLHQSAKEALEEVVTHPDHAVEIEGNRLRGLKGRKRPLQFPESPIAGLTAGELSSRTTPAIQAKVHGCCAS